MFIAFTLATPFYCPASTEEYPASVSVPENAQISDPFQGHPDSAGKAESSLALDPFGFPPELSFVVDRYEIPPDGKALVIDCRAKTGFPLRFSVLRNGSSGVAGFIIDESDGTPMVSAGNAGAFIYDPETGVVQEVPGVRPGFLLEVTDSLAVNMNLSLEPGPVAVIDARSILARASVDRTTHQDGNLFTVTGFTPDGNSMRALFDPAASPPLVNLAITIAGNPDPVLTLEIRSGEDCPAFGFPAFGAADFKESGLRVEMISPEGFLGTAAFMFALTKSVFVRAAMSNPDLRSGLAESFGAEPLDWDEISRIDSVASPALRKTMNSRMAVLRLPPPGPPGSK